MKPAERLSLQGCLEHPWLSEGKGAEAEWGLVERVLVGGRSWTVALCLVGLRSCRFAAVDFGRGCPR